MEPALIAVTVSVVTLILAVLSHAFTTGRWGAKIETSMGFIQRELANIGKELEKRDVQIQALWKRIDEIRDLIDTKVK